MEPLTSFFAVSVILLGIGIYGLTTKRNAIRILFSVELIYNAANLNIIASLGYVTRQLLPDRF